MVDHATGPGRGAGANFGWPYFEGETTRRNGAPADVVQPIISYGHGSRCAVTGGVVYRGTKVPGLDMLSFGPQIEFPHSPDERVSIPTVERFWQLLVAVVDDVSDPEKG